ncbi:MAG: PD-(D/E)XK nuclease family protein [Thermoguttaceae bacterium]
MKREFLGWNSPLLDLAANYFLERFTLKDGKKSRRFDMRNVLVVLPGRRAINRLEEKLTELVEKKADDGSLDSAWYPPQMITFGSLPEKFYELKRPIADDMTQRFAWLRAIDQLDADAPNLCQVLVPNLPSREDFVARLQLGKLFATIHKELAIDGIEFSDVEKISRNKFCPKEADRWSIMAKLQQKYLAELDRLDVWDLQIARHFAIKNQSREEEEQIRQYYNEQKLECFLVGLVDMNEVPKRMLQKFGNFVTALVFAPETLSSRFDEFGCLIPNRWTEVQIPIQEDQIEIVQKQEHQANAVIRFLAKAGEKIAPQEIVIGTQSEDVIPFLMRRFDQAGLIGRHFSGTPMTQTGLFRLLFCARNFIETRSFEDFAELVRHPDIETIITKKWKKAKGILSDLSENDHPNATPNLLQNYTDSPSCISSYISELDDYFNHFLPEMVDGNWHEIVNPLFPKYNQTFESLKFLWKSIVEIFGLEALLDLSFTTNSVSQKKSTKKPIIFWTEKWKSIFNVFYQYDEREASQSALKIASNSLQVLEQLALLKYRNKEPFFSEVTEIQALDILLPLLEKGNIPPHHFPDAIEMLGWLELPMDDASFVVVTSMNDGITPSYHTSDSFLPDHVRKHLGIEDNARRHARDVYALLTILETRKEVDKKLQSARLQSPNEIGLNHAVHLIVPRTLGGDTLIPSRLLFAADEKTVAKRVQQFFKTPPPECELLLEGTCFPAQQDKSTFTVPKLDLYYKNSRVLMQTEKPVMRVTEFKDYLKCPFRYFLKHQLRLSSVQDDADELNAPSFGNMVHDVLQRFGNSDAKDTTSAENIEQELTHWLDLYCREHFGNSIRASISIQKERLLARLKKFASDQSEWRKNGYKIIATEFSFDGLLNPDVALEVDGKQMFLRGRIDRIDQNEKTGKIVIWDYKTSDSNPKDPVKDHFNKKTGWIDFQLPLYDYILRRAGFCDQKDDALEIELGYISISSKMNQSYFKTAKWNSDDINDAIEKAKDIVRSIWNHKFLKKEPPPLYGEDLAAICMDNVLKL